MNMNEADRCLFLSLQQCYYCRLSVVRAPRNRTTENNSTSSRRIRTSHSGNSPRLGHAEFSRSFARFSPQFAFGRVGRGISRDTRWKSTRRDVRARYVRLFRTALSFPTPVFSFFFFCFRLFFCCVDLGCVSTWQCAREFRSSNESWCVLFCLYVISLCVAKVQP